MNAFEKIKERLSERGTQQYEYVPLLHETVLGRKIIAVEKALDIVSEVEAEFGKDINVRGNKSTEYINKSSGHINKLSDCSSGWIPCEKELPPEPEENPEFDGKPLEVYLVSFKGTKYPWRAFWTGKNFTDGWSIVHPEAWMPLPEPWKPKT